MAKGTKDDPWQLKTPPGTSDITLWRDPTANPPALVCIAGGTELRYHISAPEDLAAMLKKHGDWMEFGNADEQKPAKDGTIEAWARSPDNPKKGLVRLEEGPARPLRQLCDAGRRGARAGRARAQPQEQPGPGEIGCTPIIWMQIN